jgi:hypothetical protein
MANENYDIIISVDDENSSENENNNIINNNVIVRNRIFNRINNNEGLLSYEYVRDYVNLIPLFIVKNEINKKAYIHVWLFILISILSTIEAINLVISWNIFSSRIMYYGYFLLLNIIFAEIMTFIKMIFQYIELSYEIIHIKYRYSCLVENILLKLYIISIFVIIVHDFNENNTADIYYSLSKTCIYLSLSLIIIYDYYLQYMQDDLKEKYNRNDQETNDKYNICIENIIMEDNIENNIDINGNFVELDNNELVSTESDDMSCVICMEEFINNENVFISKCNHIYHKKCIIKWFLNNNSCPICREILFK